MPELLKKTVLPFSSEVVDAWHARPGAFERLAPPWQKMRVESRELVDPRDQLAVGTRLVMRMKQGPLWLRWVARHTERTPGQSFQDVQEAGPFARWVHTHRFEGTGEGACELVDRLDWELPLAPLGRWVAGGFVARDLDRVFSFRHRRTSMDLNRHAELDSGGPQRVAVSGASGLVGAALSGFLRTGGHEVCPLVRRAPAAGEIGWSPAERRLDGADLEGVHGVVHLAGEPLVGRWTEEKKRSILVSRVEGTRLVAETLAGMASPPKVMVSASAIGVYGDRGDEELTEESAPGDGFLAEVCRAWEEAVRPAEEAGIRVVRVRIGVVLTPQGGALAKMLTPFKLGVGGPVGSGAQWMSWIALDDLVAVLHRALFDPELSGPVNAVAPQPVRQREFAKTLGRVLRRPAVLPLPAAAVKLAFGEMGEAVLLAGQRVQPKALQEAGFRFDLPELEGALRFALGAGRA